MLPIANGSILPLRTSVERDEGPAETSSLKRKAACFVILLFGAVARARGASFDHAIWDRTLKTYVSELGEVDYRALKANRNDLDDYVRSLGAASPASRPDLFPSRAHELAYWMNAYNAFVIRGVIDHYPIKSVRDAGVLYGFFWRDDYLAGGVKISLFHLENEVIRKKYREPRIHFGIVCAAVSCPLLSRAAFTAENLETQLEQLTRRFINERRNLMIDPVANTAALSKIFDWYTKDFEAPVAPGEPQGTLIEYVRRHANDDNRRALDALRRPKITFSDYDWSLNEPGSRARARSPLDRELAGVSATSGRH